MTKYLPNNKLFIGKKSRLRLPTLVWATLLWATMTAPPTVGATLLRWSLKAGDVCEIAVRQNGKRITDGFESTVETELGLRWTVLDVTENAFHMELTLDRLKTTVAAPDVDPLLFDSTSPEGVRNLPDAMRTSLQSLVGGKVQFWMNDRGEITDLQFPGTLTLPLTAPAVPISNAAVLRETLSNMLPDLPEKGVELGESWSRSMTAIGLGASELGRETNYVYRGPVTDDMPAQHRIDAASTLTIKSADAAPQIDMANQTNSAAYIFDSDLGRIDSCELKQTVEITVRGTDAQTKRTTSQIIRETFIQFQPVAVESTGDLSATVPTPVAAPD